MSHPHQFSTSLENCQYFYFGLLKFETKCLNFKVSRPPLSPPQDDPFASLSSSERQKIQAKFSNCSEFPNRNCCQMVQFANPIIKIAIIEHSIPIIRNKNRSYEGAKSVGWSIRPQNSPFFTSQIKATLKRAAKNIG